MQRYQVIPRVLVFLTREEKVLLIQGAPDKRHWANLYNGLGGHVERGESVLEAAEREVWEESGLLARNLWLCAAVTIDLPKEESGILMFVFRGEALEEEVTASKEGELKWVRQDEVKGLDLVEDLPILLSLVLELSPQGAPLWGRYWYDKQGKLRTEFT